MRLYLVYAQKLFLGQMYCMTLVVRLFGDLFLFSSIMNLM